MPPTREEIKALVDDHLQLEDPMGAAIWICQDAPDAHLVELLPDYGYDPQAHKPFVFAPGYEFRYHLSIYAGDLRSLQEAIARDHTLASWISKGEILWEKDQLGQDLVKLATEVGAHAQAS